MNETISRDELWVQIQSTSVAVLEALPQAYYDREHLPGAKNLPLDNIDAMVPRLVPDKRTPVVTYCSNTACSNSRIAAARLRSLGYLDVRAFEGGKQEWNEAGLPVETTE